jgi:hypothetical protein
MSDGERPQDTPPAARKETVEHASIEVRDMHAGEASAAVGVLARGMRDNPLHIRAYGSDPARRERCAGRVMAGLFRAFPEQEPICAVTGPTLVAVTGVAPPGTCQPTATAARSTAAGDDCSRATVDGARRAVVVGLGATRSR